MDRLPFAPSPLTSTWAAVAIVFFALPTAWGQEDGEKPKEVVLERTALKIKDPQEYHVRMQLRPTREVTIAAPARGVVQLVPVKTGQSVRSQGELVRLKSEERLLEQKIASAEFKAAQIAHDKASGDDKTILAAKLDAAKARLELAEFRVSQTILNAPFDGEVRDLPGQGTIAVGESVLEGEPVMRMIDPSELWVEIPVDRTQVKAGDSVSVPVDGAHATGTIQAITEATGEFQKLQDLFQSVAIAKVLFDNGSGQLKPGQAVRSDMIPRHPIAEVPLSAIRNTGNAETERMVQIIRDGFVRNIPIQVLGQIGPTHVYVSARFTSSDELIASSSEPVPDGSWVRSLLDVPASLQNESGNESSNPVPPVPGGTPLPKANRSKF